MTVKERKLFKETAPKRRYERNHDTLLYETTIELLLMKKNLTQFVIYFTLRSGYVKNYNVQVLQINGTLRKLK